jgi:hypothetical protein
MSEPLISYKRHRFPPQIIAHAVWLYFRFPLSLRLVEELLLERGIVVSYETKPFVHGADFKDSSKRFQPFAITSFHRSHTAPQSLLTCIASRRWWSGNPSR